MAAYESDSSDDGNEYTTTNVILGYASTESGGDEISHIGGHPTWIDPKTTPLASLAKCKVCNGYMSLLLQLNADLQQYFPNDQRRIFVWSCKNRRCAKKHGSMRIFRETKKGKSKRTNKPIQPASKPREPDVDLGSALFGGTKTSAASNANPFSTSAQSQPSSTNPFSKPASISTLAAKPPQNPQDNEPPTETFADKLKIGVIPSNEKPRLEVWPETSAFPEPFPFFYLEADPEELDPTPASAPEDVASSSRVVYDTEDASSSAQEKDTFESSLDKTFQKFSDIIAQNPEQVLRYEFKGQPLLYSSTDGVSSRFVVPHGKAGAVKGMPRCEKCGSQRVFELQLTPHLILELEKDDTMDIDDGMEWGTIIVGTCASNCGDEDSVTFREEWLGVQWEERMSRK